MQNLNFKGVEDNSVIKEIGGLFRSHSESEWRIDVKLDPEQNKSYFSASQLPVLARRRVLNATEQKPAAGYPTSVVIENAQQWHVERKSSCVIPAVSGQGDRQQGCFVFVSGETQYYLPQQELARVLFFHHAYLTRLSFIQNGLSQEFDVQQSSNASRALIGILPTSTLPTYVRDDYALRRHLAWVLLDDDARYSFESIARLQFQHGSDTEKYRRWDFRFEPPTLAGVELQYRGHYNKDLSAFFVYEIHSISNLDCVCPSEVDFVDPKFKGSSSGKGFVSRPGASTGSTELVDDEQEPDVDKSVKQIHSPTVAFEFVKPIQTNRVSSRNDLIGRRFHEEPSDLQESRIADVSTGEPSTLGILPGADYDGLNDQSDDSHLYAQRLAVFEAMVEELQNMEGCILTSREVRKLRSIKGYRKHLHKDGNPRCLAFHLFTKSDNVYALLEVDTSDNSSRLSTLLLKKRGSTTYWESRLEELEFQLLKHSLVWPTKFLNKEFGGDCKRISHPKTTDNLLRDRASIQRWAERVYLEMT